MTALLHLLVLSARKNVLFLAADDLRVQLGVDRVPGTHSMSTPNMDALVAEGVMLNRHYVYRMCTPSRSSFISGRLPVHVTQKLKDPEAPNCGVPRNMTGIATKMAAAGYKTAMFGKCMPRWGRTPCCRGRSLRRRELNWTLAYGDVADRA